MKPKVYLETTIVSYLTARPSSDLIITAHQQLTQEWWANRRTDFELYASQLVLTEASAGEAEMALRRLEKLEEATLLEIKPEAVALARALVTRGPLPEKAAADALHIAIATVHGIDYLLTWNCKAYR